MKKPLVLLSLMAALSAGSAIAQSESAADPAPEAPIVGGDLDLGEDPNAAPANGPNTYIKDTFGDWDLQCVQVNADGEVCQMYQLLADGEGNSVAEVSIFKLKEGGQAVAGGTIVVPLETLLTQKLTVVVDGGNARRYDFAFCSPIGCYARVGFTAADIAAFKAGALAKVTIVPALAPSQKVTLDMSLSGFTAAFDQASTLTQ